MAKPRILIAEDEFGVAREAKDCLERLGYGVADVVTSSETAIEKAVELRPNLILMDIRLNKRINGSKAAEYIYKQYDMPVIYLTSSGDNKPLQRNTLAEPFGHVVTPFEERELHQAIELALYKHRMERERKQCRKQLEALTAERMAELAIAHKQRRQEIAERQRAEAALQKSEERYKQLVEAVTDYIYSVKVKRDQAVATSHGPGCIAVTGYSSQEYKADPYLWIRMVHEEDRPVVIEQAAKVLSGEKVAPLEHRIIHKDGSIRWVRNTLVPHYNVDGHLVSYDGMISDVTARKQAEAALQTSEASLRAIFDNSLQAFVLIDRAGKVLAFNKTASGGIKLILGKEIKAGDSIFDFVHEAWLDEFSRSFNRALNGESVGIEQKVDIKHKNYWFQFNFNPVLVGDSQVIGVCFCTVNIDDHKRITDALVASEDRLLAELQSMLFITSALVSETNLNKLLDLIITQAKYLLNVSGAMVLLLSENGQHFIIATPGTSQVRIESGSSIPVQGSLAGLAIASQQVQVINHVSTNNRAPFMRVLLKPFEPGSLLCAPLITQNKTLGVLLMWSDLEGAFTPHQHHLMSLFVDQAALGLYNAYLHTQNHQLTILQERQRLARELHDSVTQSLHSIGLAADAALIHLDRNMEPSRVRDPLEHIHALSKIALANIREHLYHLHPTVFEDRDLSKALAQHCHRLSKLYDLDIDFEINLESTLSVSQRHALYFIIREALWNVVKHAEATHINVVLTREGDQIVGCVEDDGIGFDPALSASDGTMGMRSMKERAMLLGGKVELKSRVGQGTRCIARVPLQSS